MKASGVERLLRPGYCTRFVLNAWMYSQTGILHYSQN